MSKVTINPLTSTVVVLDMVQLALAYGTVILKEQPDIHSSSQDVVDILLVLAPTPSSPLIKFFTKLVERPIQIMM